MPVVQIVSNFRLSGPRSRDQTKTQTGSKNMSSPYERVGTGRYAGATTAEDNIEVSAAMFSRCLFVFLTRPPSLMSARAFRDVCSVFGLCGRLGGWMFIVGLAILPCASLAQPNSTPAVSGRRSSVRVDTLGDNVDLTVGSFLQTDLGYQRSGSSGFDLRTARIRVTADAGITRAFLQTDVVGSPSVLDARLVFRPEPRIRIRAGLFKSPLSRSHLTSRSVLPFVERPTAVDALAPRRQVGGSVRVRSRSNRLRLSVGVFNGNGRALEPNDNDLYLYVGRLEARPWNRETRVQVAINGAYSIDDDIALPGLSERFSGRRAVVGGDLTLSRGRWRVVAEGLLVSLSPKTSRTGQIATGGYVMATASLTEMLDVVGRIECYDADRLDEDHFQAVSLGLNARPAPVLRFQLTGTVPMERRGPNRDDASVTVRAQFSFR